MSFKSLCWRYRVALFLAVMLMEASTLPTSQENATNVTDSISGKSSPTRLKTTKSLLNKNVGSHFRNMLRLIPRCFRYGANPQNGFEESHHSQRKRAMDCLSQENAKNVNDMISGQMTTNRFKTTKSALLMNNGSYFYAILGLDNKQHSLPNEIGMRFFSFKGFMV
jgi:hypothetical protein